MNEELLHFIWKFQYLNTSSLTCTTGNEIVILQPGIHNQNQGPDFLDARIQIGDTVWAGHVEMHVFARDWIVHGHTGDENYKNVILHVVWENDEPIRDHRGQWIPTLELKGRVATTMLDRYRHLMELPHHIPCTGHVHRLTHLSLLNWKERLVVERLQEKTKAIQNKLSQSKGHWEEVFWRLTAKNFGVKVNAAVFEMIAETLPVSLLQKHKHNRIQIEALLFGQARLLERPFVDKYPVMLRKEYQFYKKKYGLRPVDGLLQFLRMRPANFPTLRLSQLAGLIFEGERLFSKIRDAKEASEVYQLFNVCANDYWHYHYVFDEESAFLEKNLGKQMIYNLLINTVVPLLYAYGKITGDDAQSEKAIYWLTGLPAENNRVTRAFEAVELENKTAFDSQALYQLKTHYCDVKSCLQCAIGVSILGKSTELSPPIRDV